MAVQTVRDDTCEYDGCDKTAAIRVKTVLGYRWFCHKHGYEVAHIESEWERAEAEMHQQRWP